MAWSTPVTAVANASLTSAQWNAGVRDNMLLTAPALATAAGNFFVSNGANSLAQRIPVSDTVNTAEATSNTSYTNLASAGPTASNVISDIRVIVWWVCQANNNLANTESRSSIDISGATTQAATDNYCTDVQQPSSGTAFIDICTSRVVRLTVTAGTNTYQMKYRVNNASSSGTFRNRSMVVLPF